MDDVTIVKINNYGKNKSNNDKQKRNKLNNGI